MILFYFIFIYLFFNSNAFLAVIVFHQYRYCIDKEKGLNCCFASELCTWAASWQNEQNDCASSESKCLLCAQWVAKDLSFLRVDSEDWSDWADAQAELRLRWTHSLFCWFCHVAGYIFLKMWRQKYSPWLLERVSRVTQLFFFALALHMKNIEKCIAYWALIGGWNREQ